MADNLTSYEIFKQQAFYELGVSDEATLKKIYAHRIEREKRLLAEIKDDSPE